MTQYSGNKKQSQRKQQSINVWNSEAYDHQLGYVSELGKELVPLLNPQKDEQILDIGCGTGDLTDEISKSGANVIGIDLSPEMIQKAQQKYPHLAFRVDNAVTFRSKKSFDAVFSNAALHWIKQAEQVIESIWLSLKPGGRLVAELGGKDNVGAIIAGMEHALSDFEISSADRNQWYFPSIGEYSTLLEERGFRVRMAVHFDRPTPLDDGIDGLRHWLDHFADDWFDGLSPQQKTIAYQKTMDYAKPLLFQNGQWVADYKRIRVLAEKPYQRNFIHGNPT